MIFLKGGREKTQDPTPVVSDPHFENKGYLPITAVPRNMGPMGAGRVRGRD